MSYKVYKKHVNKYSKKVPGATSGNQTQSVYLFSGRSITPDKKQVVNVKNSGIYGRVSGASTDRTHNLNRNLSLTAITGTSVTAGHSRNLAKKDIMSTLKSKGSISSSSSYNQHASNTKGGSKTFRKVIQEDLDNDSKLAETIKVLKNENK